MEGAVVERRSHEHVLAEQLHRRTGDPRGKQADAGDAGRGGDDGERDECRGRQRDDVRSDREGRVEALMQERDDRLEQARLCMVKRGRRHQVVDAPLVDARERAGGDEPRQRRERDAGHGGYGGAAGGHDALRPAAL